MKKNLVAVLVGGRNARQIMRGGNRPCVCLLQAKKRYSWPQFGRGNKAVIQEKEGRQRERLEKNNFCGGKGGTGPPPGGKWGGGGTTLGFVQKSQLYFNKGGVSFRLQRNEKRGRQKKEENLIKEEKYSQSEALNFPISGERFPI